MRSLIVVIFSVIPMAFGIIKSSQAAKEVCLLREILQMILLLKEQIRFSLKELDDIIKHINANSRFGEKAKGILSVALKEKEYEGLKTGLQSLLGQTLKKEQLTELCELFYGLGKSDLEGQLDHLSYYEKVFSLTKERSENEKNTKIKLYLGLSFSLSGALFVLLI